MSKFLTVLPNVKPRTLLDPTNFGLYAAGPWLSDFANRPGRFDIYENLPFDVCTLSG